MYLTPDFDFSRESILGAYTLSGTPESIAGSFFQKVDRTNT